MAADTGVLTTLLNTFVTVFSGGFSRVFPDAMSLLSMLAVLEITIAALWWALAEENALISLLKKIIQIGFFIFIVTNYQSLIGFVLDGFVTTGIKAGGGGSISLLKDPSTIIDYGFFATDPIFKQIEQYGPVDSLAHLPTIIMTGISGLLVVLAFFALAIQVFITYLEFFLISVLGLILIPFGVFKYTSFIAEKVFGAIISFGIRLMVLSFILTIAQPTLASLRLPADPSFQQIWVLLLTALTIMGLSWHAPAVASGLISGAPSLSAHAGVALAVSASAGLAGTGLAGKQAAKDTAKGAVSATKAAASFSGAISSAASLGAAGAGGGPISQGRGALRAVGSLAGQVAQEEFSTAVGGIAAGYGKGQLRAFTSTGGQRVGSNATGAKLSAADSSGPTAKPNWARNLQAARMAIPREVHPGAGMSVPLPKDS